jgi:hypothetical protein
MGKPEGKSTLGRPKRMWVDNIEMDLRDRMGLVWNGFRWLRTQKSKGLLTIL